MYYYTVILLVLYITASNTMSNTARVTASITQENKCIEYY